MSAHPVPASLREARSALAAGHWSAEGLCEWALERAGATAALRAFTAIDAEGALRAARAVDRAAAAPGDPGRERPPLAGIPLAHKDLFYRPERTPGCGSQVRLPDRPGLEATALLRLRAAGAIDLGSLHLSEFAYGPTGHNALLGAACNPWQREHVAGGSSSGSAIAVATGAAYASLGTDSGGSIRTPASWCGVTGLKPTRGRIPTGGCVPLSPWMDTIGLIARSAEDIAWLARVLFGDGSGPLSEGAQQEWDAALQRAAAPTQIRLGVVDPWFHEDLAPAVAAGMDAARATWAGRLGARIVAARMPGLDSIVAHARTVLLHEAWRTHRELIERQDTRYAPPVLARLLAGQDIEEAEWRAALAEAPALLQGVLDESFRDADVLLLPANPATAPRIDATDPATLGHAAPPILREVDAITRCLRPFNFLGLPALQLPAGQDGQGLPFGLQLVGRPGREAELLTLGQRWQAVTDWHRRRPPGFELA